MPASREHMIEIGKNTRITKENAKEMHDKGEIAKKEKMTIKQRVEQIRNHIARDKKGKPILNDEGKPMTWGELADENFVKRTTIDQRAYEYGTALLGEAPVDKTEMRVTASLTDEDRALMSALLDRKGDSEKGE